MCRPLDLFRTADLREAVLAAWRIDPSRLRQDANLEEDHARGYYRDRVVTELAQNAADAAAVVDEGGHLLLRLSGHELLAANTGAPLTVDGVAALASMRASAKRSGSVGRFGVGFAAVRSVADELAVATLPAGPGGEAAGVAFSLTRTADLLDHEAATHAALAAEVARRHGELPALRLPFVDPTPAVPAGFATAVRLHLRGASEVTAVRAALAELGDALLLALPALTEVTIDIDGDVRRVADVADRWVTVHAAGSLEPALLAARPVEERERTGWAVTWAAPRGGLAAHGPRPVVHAPTPTEEASTLPALLVATFPLDPSRRHVAPGLLTDTIVEHAAALYPALVAAVEAHEAHPFELVPTGLPAGPLDAALHRAVVERLARTPMLREAGGELLAPRAAQALLGPAGADGAVVAALAPMVGGLVPVPGHLLTQARAVGVELRELGDVVDTMGTAAPPDRWHDLYAALAPHAAAHREALSALPVPLADGRTTRGARGVLLPAGELPGSADVFGLRAVHPGATHPVLATLGAVPADAAAVLDDPAVRAAVDTLVEEPDGGPGDAPDGAVAGHVVAAVLDLVGLAVRQRPGAPLPGWLATLPLPAATGGTAPAGGLVLPGSWAEGVLDALDVLAPEVADRWGEAALRAVGVRADITTVVLADVVAEPDDDDPVEGWSDYLDHLADVLGPGAYVGGVAVVTDLDAVADDAWAEVLARVATDPAARAALLEPVRAESGGRPDREALSYTAWWLRDALGAPFAHPRARTTAPFLAAAPDGLTDLDDAVLTAVGAVERLDELDAAAWESYADTWPAAGSVPMGDAVTLWRALAAAPEGARLWDVPAVPVLAGTTARMVPAGDVVVATPMWAQARAVVPAPAGALDHVADLFDLDTAPETVPDLTGAVLAGTPAAVRAVLPAAAGQWWECEEISVGGVPVSWWVAEGTVYATTTAGLARALAHAAGSWPARHAVEAVLTDPDVVDELLAEFVGD